MGVTTTGIFGVARNGVSTHSRRPVPRISDGPDSCRRCGGFLVDEHCMESDIGPSQPGYTFWAMRCVQCGDMIDETILRNRLRLLPHPPRNSFKGGGREICHI